jgi:hypothetical protein
LDPSFVLPNLKGPLTIPGGFTQTGIPFARLNEGTAEPTIIFCTGSGAPLSLDLVGTVQPDTTPGNATFSVSVGSNVPAGQYVAGVDQGGTITDGVIINVPEPVTEDDVIGSLVGLPPLVPFTG